MGFKLTNGSSKHGTPVPRQDRERNVSSAVVTYKLSPEELERYRAMPKPGKGNEKMPVGLMPPAETRIRNDNHTGSDEDVSFTLTKEQYLEERLASKDRLQIAREQTITPAGLSYHLKKWGLYDSDDENFELGKLAAARAAQPEPPVETEVPTDVPAHTQSGDSTHAFALTTEANKSSEVPAESPITYNWAQLAHRALLNQLHTTYVAKNSDYGNSFGQLYQEFGMVSVVIRLSDKLSRLKSLTKQPAKVADESIRDTLLDLANYAVMAVIELDAGTDASQSQTR